MPTYDYSCQANGQVVEVNHRINELLSTWGELCTKAGIEPGDTPADSPVSKLATGGNIVGRSVLSNPEPPCGTGACCPSGVCGLE